MFFNRTYNTELATLWSNWSSLTLLSKVKVGATIGKTVQPPLLKLNVCTSSICSNATPRYIPNRKCMPMTTKRSPFENNHSSTMHNGYDWKWPKCSWAVEWTSYHSIFILWDGEEGTITLHSNVNDSYKQNVQRQKPETKIVQKAWLHFIKFTDRQNWPKAFEVVTLGGKQWPEWDTGRASGLLGIYIVFPSTEWVYGWVHFVNIHWTAHLWFMCFSVCCLYFNKTYLKKVCHDISVSPLDNSH